MAQGGASATVQPSRFAASDCRLDTAPLTPARRRAKCWCCSTCTCVRRPRRTGCCRGRQRRKRGPGQHTGHGRASVHSTQTHPASPTAQAKRPGRNAASAASDRMASVRTHLRDIRVCVQVIDHPKDYPRPWKKHPKRTQLGTRQENNHSLARKKARESVTPPVTCAMVVQAMQGAGLRGTGEATWQASM